MSQEQAKRAVQELKRVPAKAINITKGAVKQHIAESAEIHKAKHQAKLSALPEIERQRALSKIEVAKARALAQVERERQRPLRTQTLASAILGTHGVYRPPRLAGSIRLARLAPAHVQKRKRAYPYW